MFNFLKDKHTWVMAAIIVAGGLGALESHLTAGTVDFSIVSGILAVIGIIIQQNS